MPKNVKLKGTDHISQLAKKNKFRTWKTVWEANSSLHSKREKANILDHQWSGGGGDTVTVPDREEKWVGKSVDNKRESPHLFKVKTDKLFLRIRILNDGFEPITDADYELKVDGMPEPFEGKTDGDGKIQHEVDRGSTKAKLTVSVKAEDSEPAGSGGGDDADDASGGDDGAVRGDVPVTWDLQIGALDPVCEKAPDDRCISGVQQRLNNLCINTGPVDGILGPNTRAAIRAFQDLYKLDIPEAQKGQPDQAKTQKKLQEVHDDPATPPKPPSDTP